ncbi:MAG TPA: Gfo/Idh/MocA family oxidoreductase [Bacillota bacterium]|nr:Gfo/Idh/MocA family oxidoreductase [Bacillota bacterium]
MRKLRVGIIGTGMALEKLHYPAYQELADKYQIVALCDVDRDKAESWAKRLGIDSGSVYTDYRAMALRGDIDLFDIMVPIEKNFEVTDAVASIARKPIICEKPLAPDLEQARAHAEIPRKYGIPVMIAENYRYNEEIDRIRDFVRTGKVGDILYFIQNRVVDFPEDMLKDRFPAREWRQRPEFQGGAILDTAVHDIAALRHIFGAVDRLQAFGRQQRGGFTPYSAVSVNIQFRSGVIGTFSFFCSGKEMQRPLVGLRIFGTEGMIYLEERDCGFINVMKNDGTHELVPYRPQRGYYNELLNFYNAAVGKEPLSVTPEMEFGDAKMVFDILKSIEEESIVEVDREAGYIPIYRAKGIDKYQHPHLTRDRYQ